MKAALKIILIFFFYLSIASDCPADEYHFRKIKWGMSISQVKATETLKLVHDSREGLMYEAEVLNKKVLIGYLFTDNKLVRAKYLLNEKHSNKNDYITDYYDFQDILKKKYGTPESTDIKWRNDLFKNDISKWGMAISVGHLRYTTFWDTPETSIICQLSGDNHNIVCGVQYTGKKFRHTEKKAKEKKAMNDF